MSQTPQSISAICPVYNEEDRLESQLEHLSRQGFDELIVVDGQSEDRSRQIADGFSEVRVISSARGRGIQLNAGARCAFGDILLFVHADVRLPPRARSWIEGAMSHPDSDAGAFVTHTVSDSGRLGPLLRLADLRSRYTKHPYGDQCLFIRRSRFKELGGFREKELMEDLEFSQRLSERTQIFRVPAQVQVSGRRFEERPILYTAMVNLFPFFYRLGVSAETLARLYRHVR